MRPTAFSIMQLEAQEGQLGADQSKSVAKAASASCACVVLHRRLASCVPLAASLLPASGIHIGAGASAGVGHS
jgi:hypothetical protein